MHESATVRGLVTQYQLLAAVLQGQPQLMMTQRAKYILQHRSITPPIMSEQSLWFSKADMILSALQNLSVLSSPVSLLPQLIHVSLL